MLRFLFHRTLALIPLLLLVSIVTFGLLFLTPGDPAMTLAGDSATPQMVEAIRRQLGLDASLPVQYWRWLIGVLHGDFGTSIVQNYKILPELLGRMPVTLSLVGLSLVFAAMMGIPLGVLAAVRRGSLLDRALTVLASVCIALPVFWFGLVIVYLFALKNSWLPATGYQALTDSPLGWLSHMVMPAFALAIPSIAEIMRQTREGMTNALRQDYVRTLRANGIREARIIGRHAMKNAMIPVITVIGLQVPHKLAVGIVVEQVFNLPGLGTLAVNSVFARDVPVLQGIVIMTTLLVVSVNMLVDLSYGYFNPKVRS